MTKGKWEEQKQARKLRSDGKSINEIKDILKVSKSSVSNWVRDIKLTKEQIEILKMKNPIYNNELKRLGIINYYKKQRKEYQKIGNILMKNNEIDFIVGCMLYWCEGAKDKNVFHFCNSDKEMIGIMIKFLKKYFSKFINNIILDIYCYSNSGLNSDKIKNHWKKITGLYNNKINIKMDYDKRTTSGNKIKYPYGICHIKINRTEVVQKVFGGIKEYAKIKDKDKWLF